MTAEASGAGKMTGQYKGPSAWFSYGAELDRRGRADHSRRRVQARLDFAFVRAAVAPNDGDSGNGSVDPGGGGNSGFCFSRRPSAANASRCGACPERLDGRWFLGSSRDDETPNHSVLAKARARWRGEVFAELFVRTVRECVGAGLVDGTTGQFDGCLVAAGGAHDRVVKADTATSARIRAADGAQKRKRDETKPPAARGETNRTRVSTTDPDASGGSKGPSSGPARPRYPHYRRGPARAGLALVRTASGARRRPPRPHANDRAGATARGKIRRDESPAGQDHEGRERARPVDRGGSGAPRVSPVEGLDSAHPAPAGLGDPGA